MRRNSLVLLTLLTAVSAASAARAQEEITLAEGAHVYAATCGRCHNARAPGERSDREWGVIMQHMRTRGNLSGRETRAALFFLQSTNVDAGENSDAPEPQGALAPTLSVAPAGALPVVKFTSAGGPKSPAGLWSHLGRQAGASAEEGRKLVEKVGCVACHKVGKHSAGTLGPDLNTVFKRRDADYIRRKLTNPKLDNASSIMPQLNLTAEQQAAIIDYLRSIQK